MTSTPEADDLESASHHALSLTDLESLRAKLDAEVNRSNAFTEASSSDEQAVRQDTGHDEMDEVITRVDTQRSMADVEDANARLAQAVAALRRIDTGNYGWCVARGRPITRERLLALPTAARCIQCQSRLHRHR